MVFIHKCSDVLDLTFSMRKVTIGKDHQLTFYVTSQIHLNGDEATWKNI